MVELETIVNNAWTQLWMTGHRIVRLQSKFCQDQHSAAAPDNRGASERDVLIAFLAVSTRGFSPGTASIDKLIPADSQSCAGILELLKIPDQL